MHDCFRFERNGLDRRHFGLVACKNWFRFWKIQFALVCEVQTRQTMANQMRLPCGVAIKTLVDLMNWMVKPQVFGRFGRFCHPMWRTSPLAVCELGGLAGACAGLADIITGNVLRACSDFDRFVRGAPFLHPTPQGRWVQFQKTRLQG